MGGGEQAEGGVERYGPLRLGCGRGEVDGGTVECRPHVSRFDPRTGEPLDPPATRPVPGYPAGIDDGVVYARVRPQRKR